MIFRKHLFCAFTFCTAFFIQNISYAQQETKARSYYVSLTGNDEYAGTLTAPLKTINKINGINFNAGYTVCFKSGETFSGTIDFKKSGDKSHPIIITSYGEG